MKHYNNPSSHSRLYYINLQKNLNSSNKKVDTLEDYLEKFLLKTYVHLAPIFEDDDIMTNYKNETTNNFIDKQIDEEVFKYTPLWVQSIITFFVNWHKKYFKKYVEIKLIKTAQHITELISQKTKTKHKKTSNFIRNKSLP